MEYVETKSGNNDNCCSSSPCPDLLTNSKSDVQDETDNKNTENECNEATPPKDHINFIVIYNKKKINVNLALDGTIADLKAYLQNIIAVPQAMQKVMIKGLAKDDQTLRNLGVTEGAKVMVVGSKLDDVLAVSIPTKQELVDEATTAVSKEPLSQQKLHRKILDKGMPDDVMPGILDSKDPLPEIPIAGMLNKFGGKVRLTFKLEQDQLWIGTKERTDKIQMNTIKGVHSEPIHDHPEYHIMGIQLGPTDSSRYWIYWVPAQYTSAIKEAILDMEISVFGDPSIKGERVYGIWDCRKRFIEFKRAPGIEGGQMQPDCTLLRVVQPVSRQTLHQSEGESLPER